MDRLNDDCLLAIFEYLDLDERIKLMRVCKRWYYLLSYQVSLTKSLRLGSFTTNKISLEAASDHQQRVALKHSSRLFSKRIFELPADEDTHCFRINQYDYFHRCLTQCSQSLIALTLGHVLVDYRCLVSLLYNCSNLEYLELQSCATENLTQITRGNRDLQQQQQQGHAAAPDDDQYQSDKRMVIPAADIKRCELVKSKKWQKMCTLVINQCDSLNESMICLLLALSAQSLKNLTISSHQYFTGESLQFCSSTLETFSFKSCPSLSLTLYRDFTKVNTKF